MVVFMGGVCRSRQTQREANGVFGLALLLPLPPLPQQHGMVSGEGVNLES